jgi:capsular polysaccharide biosynthesis protein/Mrp family chromosome partitioning ATPase
MTTDDTTPLSQYLQPLLAYKRVVGLVTAVVVLLGLFVGFTASKSYTSESSILVFPISGDPTKALESDDSEVEMATELRIATSQAVMSSVVERLEAQSISFSLQELEDSVSASTTKESRILDIAFEGTSPAVAQAGASAFVDAYLELRSDISSSSKLASETEINARIVILKEELAAVTTRLNATPENSSSAVILEVEQRSISGELVAQQSALADLSTLTIDATRIIDPAHLPRNPGGLTLLQTLVGALAAGLVLGIVSAYLLAAFDGANQPHNRRIADKQTPQLMESLQGVISAVTSAASAVKTTDTAETAETAAAENSSEATPAAAAAPQPPAPEPVESPAVQPAAEPAAESAQTPPAPPAPTPTPAPAEPAAEPSALYGTPASDAETPASVQEPEPTHPMAQQFQSQPQFQPVPTALQGSAPEEVAPAPARRGPDPEPLMVSSNMEDLIAALQMLGTVGPVVGLSVGETSGATALAVAFDLAGELQSLGARVLIIDAAIEDPMLHSLLKVEAGPGLADVLSDHTSFEDAVQPLAGLEGLDALTVGTTTDATPAALLSPAFAEMLQQARADYHSVLIVSGTLEDQPIVSSLADHADGLILSTGRGPGGPVSGELCRKLDELNIATLDIISTASRIEEAIVGASSM